MDGKEVPFNGFDPVFTADNKLLTSLKSGVASIITVPDGVHTGGQIIDYRSPGVVRGVRTPIGAAPAGSAWAGVMQPRKPGDPSVLFLDGKAVADAHNPEEVVFSADGRRYMAICRNNSTRMKYVVVDGKKGPEYQSIVAGLTRFAPDSSRAIYVGNTAGKNFIVVDGQPSEGYVQLVGQANRIAVSPKGGRYGYVVGDGSGLNQTLIVDGKPVPLDGKAVVLDTLGFSPDGSRYAFVAGRRVPGNPRPALVLVVNGQEVPGIELNEISISQPMREWWIEAWGVQSKYYVFSPDGKHIAFTGFRASDKRAGVFVDSKALFVATAGPSRSFVSWTPDSKHLFWTVQEKSGERPHPYSRVFLDGKPTQARIFDVDQPTAPGIWQIGADGALQLLVFEGAAAKRYRITPGADTSIDAALAAAE